MSHPVRVRGLKHLILLLRVNCMRSHPVRVRGLKLGFASNRPRAQSVAPRAGAWIETYKSKENTNYFLSHPVRVRGLKHGLEPRYKITLCRTPCGCVD